MLTKLIALPFLILLYCSSLSAAEKVNVGGYLSPPFIEQDNQGNISGITLDLINSLNKIQHEYHFNLVLTSSRRRYVFFQQGQFDLFFFERKVWGWQDIAIVALELPFKGGDVFIALKSKAKQQDYFNSLKNKSISAMLGYHYNFADFNADPNFLRSKFDIQLSSDERVNVQLVLWGKMDIAIVTKSFLDKYLLDNPSAKSELLIATKMDQKYQHTILLRENTNLSVTTMNMLLDKLVASGEYNKIMQKYGITP